MQTANLTVGQGCHDIHLCATVLGHTVAVDEVHTALAGRRSALAHVAHLNAKVALTLVNEQLTSLEHRQAAVVTLVEILKDNIVVQQRHIVTAIAYQTLHGRYGGGMLGQLCGDSLAHSRLAGSLPSDVGIHLGYNGVPLLLTDSLPVLQLGYGGHQGGHRSLPGWVEAMRQRKLCLFVGTCQGIGAYLGHVGGKVFTTDGGKPVYLHVKHAGGIFVKLHQAATHKPIGDLLVHSIHRLHGSITAFAVRRLIGLGVGSLVLSLTLLLIHRHVILHILQRDGRLVKAQFAQYQTSCIEHLTALIGVVFHIAERHGIRAVKQQIHITQHLLEPLRCGHHLMHTQFIVAIEVHQ